MKKVNKVLVACDLSNYSIQAVEYAALADVLLGSTAQKMFHRCPIPLLSIRMNTND